MFYRTEKGIILLNVSCQFGFPRSTGGKSDFYLYCTAAPKSSLDHGRSVLLSVVPSDTADNWERRRKTQGHAFRTMEKRKLLPPPPTHIKVAPNRYLKRFVFSIAGQAKLYIEKFPRWHFIKTPLFGERKNLCKTYSMKGRSNGVYSLSGKLEKLSPRYYKVRGSSARVPLANSCFELMVYVCQHKGGRLQNCSSTFRKHPLGDTLKAHTTAGFLF